MAEKHSVTNVRGERRERATRPVVEGNGDEGAARTRGPKVEPTVDPDLSDEETEISI